MDGFFFIILMWVCLRIKVCDSVWFNFNPSSCRHAWPTLEFCAIIDGLQRINPMNFDELLIFLRALPWGRWLLFGFKCVASDLFWVCLNNQPFVYNQANVMSLITSISLTYTRVFSMLTCAAKILRMADLLENVVFVTRVSMLTFVWFTGFILICM